MLDYAFDSRGMMILNRGEQIICLSRFSDLIMSGFFRYVENPSDEQQMLAVFSRCQLLDRLPAPKATCQVKKGFPGQVMWG